MSGYVNFNGKLISVAQPLFVSGNRAFKYGDGLFETIKGMDGQPVFIEDHLDRLYAGMEFLSFAWNDMLHKSILNEEIGRLLRRNRHTEGSKIRVNVFRKDGGLYSPESNEVSVLISSSLSENNYQLNKDGLVAEVYGEIRKPINKLSQLKSANALLFVKAALAREEMEVDELFILNEQNYICEAISSNVFLVMHNRLITPPLSDGCLPGIMRQKVIDIAGINNIEVIETHIGVKALEMAEEVFVTNAITGPQWVKSFRERRYFHRFSERIIEELNAINPA